MSEALRILVLCTGNSARSVMTEAFLKRYGGDRVKVESAGSEPKGINPMTVQVLGEVGFDLSNARSQHLNEFINESWDYVITVCDNAAESCPIFPGPARRLHWPFDDPPAAPAATRLDTFRRVRDEIEQQAQRWIQGEPWRTEQSPS